jgi:hypothetical protein
MDFKVLLDLLFVLLAVCHITLPFKPAPTHTYFICLKARFWDRVPVALLTGRAEIGVQLMGSQ